MSHALNKHLFLITVLSDVDGILLFDHLTVIRTFLW